MKRETNVRLWHGADIHSYAEHVAVRGRADIPDLLVEVSF